MSTTGNSHQDIDLSTGFDPIAGIAAAAFPGAGHYISDMPDGKRRGLHIGAGVIGLFALGILVGGVDCVDRLEDGWWFIPQALVGPIAFGVDYYHQNTLKVPARNSQGPPRVTPGPGQGQTYTKSIGKPNDVGTLFTSIAGMLNLIVIIDAAFPTRRRSFV